MHFYFMTELLWLHIACLVFLKVLILSWDFTDKQQAVSLDFSSGFERLFFLLLSSHLMVSNADRNVKQTV